MLHYTSNQRLRRLQRLLASLPVCQTNTFPTTETENDFQLTGFGLSYGIQTTVPSSDHSHRRSLRSQRQSATINGIPTGSNVPVNFIVRRQQRQRRCQCVVDVFVVTTPLLTAPPFFVAITCGWCALSRIFACSPIGRSCCCSISECTTIVVAHQIIRLYPNR